MYDSPDQIRSSCFNRFLIKVERWQRSRSIQLSTTPDSGYHITVCKLK